MRRVLGLLVLLGLVVAAALWWVSRAQAVDPARFAGLEGDAARGERVFHAAGCAGCHSAPGASAETRLVLSGGQRFATQFGTFVAPNISSHPDHGIGRWSVTDLGNAMQAGVSPGGKHYYPAFPYAAYAKAAPQDIADLHAFLMTLPADATPDRPHELVFPFSVRRTVGVWKFLFAGTGWAVTGPLTPEQERGRYLAEALGHCGECHTPRNALGGLDRGRWLAGAPNPTGEGRIPNITPARLRWTEDQIATYLQSGFTPDFDVVGGHMALVVEAWAQLPAEDRAAVAAYLKAVPPRD
ncbi:MAG: c-type cytochrome [Gemmobacter sp.]